MKEIWVKAVPWRKELITTALESGADAVVVEPERVEDVKALGLIKTVSETGDLRWGEEVEVVEVQSGEDEEKIVELTRRGKKVVVKTTDWTIIPLENLVARTGNIFVEVNSLDEATTAAGILEKGVDGLIITSSDLTVVKEIITSIRGRTGTLELTRFSIERVYPLGMGDRVCIDTCTMLGVGEGCLVGNSSQAMFLVHSESVENPYVAPRPFRVNAGPVHAYVMVPGGKTKYLAELTAGDEVLGVNAKGESVPLVVGRVKIERRPLLLVEAVTPLGPAATICQNAETIRFVTPEGGAISVVKLAKGDEVVGYVEEAARHFGHKISETILER